MLIELKRCNTIGDIDGLLFLVNMLLGSKRILYKEIINRASLEKGIKINCGGAIAFLEYLGFVEIEGDDVITLETLNLLESNQNIEVINFLIKKCLNRVIEDGVFDSDTTYFDTVEGILNIKKSAFPLSYASIRNFLIATGVLEKETNVGIRVSEIHENDFSSMLRRRKELYSLEQLLENQKEQRQRGLEAEEFIVFYEKNRVKRKAYKIKRISDFDVSAGYDIVSFNNSNSIAYDRFIEVKCYVGEPHFYWSENEVEVAKCKGDKYILCLVDYSKIKEDGYEPEFIINPYNKIFKNNMWLVNTANYRVQKV